MNNFIRKHVDFVKKWYHWYADDVILRCSDIHSRIQSFVFHYKLIHFTELKLKLWTLEITTLLRRQQTSQVDSYVTTTRSLAEGPQSESYSDEGDLRNGFSSIYKDFNSPDHLDLNFYQCRIPSGKLPRENWTSFTFFWARYA